MAEQPEQVTTLASDDVSVTVLPQLGARVHSVSAFGVDLLHTAAAPSAHRGDPFFWGGYHMAPWCNRLATGPVPVGRRTVDLASNFPDGTAIHGQVSNAPWEVRDEGLFGISGGGAGWPWTYDVTLRVTVGEATLRLDYALTNTADDPMPAGVGWHPWFRSPSTVRFAARRVFPDNTGTEPQPEPVAGPFAVTGDGPLADGIDATWADIGDPAVELAWPDGLAATMSTDVADAVVVAANPAARRATAIEIQTHAPDGLRRLLGGEPYGMRLLAPGATLPLRIDLSFARRSR
jgi:aldose 1-epimerase